MNLSHSLYAYDKKQKDPRSQGGTCTPQSLEMGAIEKAKALWGKFTDVQGNFKSAGGYMTKYALCLACHLQRNCYQHRFRTLLVKYQAHKKLG